MYQTEKKSRGACDRHPRIALAAVAFAALVITLAASAQPLQFFMATNGNDHWSGHLAVPNASRSDGR